MEANSATTSLPLTPPSHQIREVVALGDDEVEELGTGEEFHDEINRVVVLRSSATIW